MFLTRLILTPQNFYDFRITDDYSLHRVVYSLFRKEDQVRILYADKGVKKGFRTVFILSAVEPVAPENSQIHMESKTFSESFLTHQRYVFEILLNPVRRSGEARMHGEKEVKNLVPVGDKNPEIARKLLLEWFLEKGAANGFQPDEENLMIRICNSQTFTQKNLADKTVTHHKVLFSGTLTVTEPELFRTAFENGIGRAKAFGFGLLQIQPILD